MSLLKTVLFAIIFTAIGGAAQAEIYNFQISVKDDISSGMEFSVEPDYLEIISAEIDNHLYPIEMLSRGYYSVYGLTTVKAGDRITFHFVEDDSFSIDTIILKLKDNLNAEEIYAGPGLILDLIPLDSVVNTQASGVAGVQDTHTVGFGIGANQIEEKGEIWISFGASFNIAGINRDSVKYSDDDGGNDGGEPVVDSVGIIGQTVIVKLDSGTPAAADSRIDIKLGPVVNSLAGNYAITVQTLDSTRAPVHSPTASAVFSIVPDVLNSVTVSPGADLTVPSDSIVIFTAIGEDSYGNDITGLSFSWAITVDSCGDVVGGAFQAQKTGECYITATAGGITDSSGLITVVPSSLDRFGLSGYPATITAGSAFPGQVVVTAYDINDNIIKNFADSIYFYSDDDSAAITYDESNYYTFQVADSGRASIAGSNFVLKLAGIRKLSVTNGVDTTTSSSITVQPTIISSYNFSGLATQTAGVPFMLIVNNAKDQYGNNANGTAVISVNHPPQGGNSPFGVPPSLNSIIIINGTGNASQTLTLAAPTVLKGNVSGVDEYTDTITVLPGVVGHFDITDYPTSITAGQAFSTTGNNPTLTVRDLYGNISLNYNDSVFFGGAETVPSGYLFVPASDSGTHTFSGDDFIFTTAGSRRVNVYDADTSLTDTTGIIAVSAAAINSFTLSEPGTVTAGTPFALSVGDAADQYGNAASGTITVADSSGAENAPDGTSPSLNNIVVYNGSGGTQQTLVKAGTVILKGTSGSAIDATGDITVISNGFGSIVLSNYPDTLNAGQPFPSPANDPIVTIGDIFGNLATNYTGIITFSGPETVPGPDTFEVADAGQKTYSGDDFIFETAGLQNLIVTDADNALADTSETIVVLPTAITSFTFSVPANATAGTPFNATVSNAQDEFGNDASGLVTVTVLGDTLSPNGDRPTINNISVNGGSGSASQVLVLTGTVKLIGSFGSFADTTDNISVGPGDLGELALSNYPDTIGAGQPFPSPANDPVVTVSDIFGNRAVNYTGIVVFTGPETVPGPDTFEVADAGQVTYSGDDFIFESAGFKRLIVTDSGNAMADTSRPILVLNNAIESFTLSAPANVTAGIPFAASISDAQDQFGNDASGLVTVTVLGDSISPNGNRPTIHDIIVNNGAGNANQILVRTGTVKLVGTFGSFADTTNDITVGPGSLGALSLTNYPDTIGAGQPFPSPAYDPVVTVSDIFGNRSTNYTGIIAFSGPETVPGPDTFEVADAGQNSYSGSDFIFEISGLRKLIVTDSGNSLADTSGPILVVNSNIESFTMSAPASVSAGIPFSASISNAQDEFGNNASGLVTVTVLGDTLAPNGERPNINDIVVMNGSGSANQILVLTSTVKLIGTYGSFADTTNDITVVPGDPGALALSNYPDSLIAGETFPSPANDPVVTVTDIFGNLSTNYTGIVTFSGPEVHPGPDTFEVSDAGQVTYSGDEFSFETSGSRRLIVTDSDNNLADTSMPIQVYPSVIASFNLNNPGPVTAGVPFALSVSNAKDQYDNNASGTVTIAVVGDSTSPNGDQPIVNDVVVNNGAGSANQVLVLTGTTKLAGTFGSFADTTSDITVGPGDLGELSLTNYPDTLLVGQPFDSDPTVTAGDIFGNTATNYTGIIAFSGAEVVPGPDTFEVADAGVKSYSGNDFAFTVSGLRRLIVTDSNNGLADTSQQIRVNPATIETFNLNNPGPVTAGVPFALTISNARDQFNNYASGVVTITVSGDTQSPNGDMPTINDIVVINGSGSANQILVLTSTVRLVGTYGAFADTTSNITVAPGAYGSLELSNYPDSLIAGQTFPSPANDPVVTAKDLFGNLSTDYDGTVTFSGAESVASPYTFLPGDLGQASFDGGDFMFTVSGRRRLRVTDAANSLADTSSQIIVDPAKITAFNLSEPGTVTAGVPFNLSVSGAADQFGNAGSGIVSIDSVGQSNAPDGTVPVFNDITVTRGSGSAQQILVRAGSTRIWGELTDSTDIVDTTAIITVLPGSLGELDIAVASPQISGVPFTGPSTITALDGFENLKYNFDASVDTIVITSSTGGSMANGVLNQNGDFVSGIADLAALSVTYNGQGGPVVFTATSESGRQGESNPVQFSSIRTEYLLFDTSQVVSGDTATGTIRIANDGDVAVNITAIDIFSGLEHFSPILNPSLPAVIPASSPGLFNFGFVVPLGAGDYSISLIVTGTYSGTQVSDSLIDADSLTVLTRSNISYVPGSLSPAVVSNGADYSITMTVHNDNGTVLNLADSSYIYFTDGAEEYQANLHQNTFVPPNSNANLVFESASIAAAFSDGLQPLNFYIYGNDIAGLVIDSITPLSDSILVQNASDIVYNSGTISPDTVLTGAEIIFSIQVHNNGQATLALDHNQVRITFGDGENQFIADVDTSTDVRVDEITGGSDTTLTFVPAMLLEGFTPGSYAPTVSVSGVQNQADYSTNIVADPILVLSPGEMRVDSLITISINAPKVNVNQEFIVRGFIRNLGLEPVDLVTMQLTSDGNSSFNDSIFVGTVDSDSAAQFDYTVTADSLPNLLEAFYCSITNAINRLSGGQAPIATPLDNSTVAIIEEEAELWLDTLYVSDDSLSTGQDFTVFARVSHSGSNSYAGSRQLTLDFGGDMEFVIADSIYRSFIIDQLLSWRVTTPDTERPSATLEVSFRDPFIDLNDSSTALGSDSLLTADLVVTARASITHRASIIGPSGAIDGVISTSQSLTVTDSLFPTGNVESSYARLILPSGFSSGDPLTQLLTGESIEWQVRAGESEIMDSLGFVCWTYDSNTGDSIPDNYIWIPIEVESRATLSFHSEIIYPPSAIDRVISPGGFFTLEALVTNIGHAGTGDGSLTLSFESAGFSVEEPLTRTFTPDSPVQWNITAPEIQLLDGTSIATVITSVPVDLNSGQPAVVLSDSAGLDVILKEELPKLILRNPTPIQGAAVAGQARDVYSFRLENSTAIATNQVALISFVFRLLSDEALVRPVNIISASSLTINDQSFTGEFDDSTVSFNLDPSILVEPDSLVEVTINITPVRNPSVNSIKLHMESDDITARVVIGGVVEQYVDVVLPDGEQFVLESTPLATMSDEFLASAKVGQNPYLAAEGNLRIGYNLLNDATIDVTIYNVNGDVVWEYQANPANGRGGAGQHFDDTAVIWDGRNSSGDRILSGVYYIILDNNTSGQTAKLKVAVVW